MILPEWASEFLIRRPKVQKDANTFVLWEASGKLDPEDGGAIYDCVLTGTIAECYAYIQLKRDPKVSFK